LPSSLNFGRLVAIERGHRSIVQ